MLVKNDRLWFQGLSPVSKADTRVFCFPYAGGAASIFSQWQSYFPENVEICPVQLPGRGERFNELAIVNLDEMVSQLVEAILPYANATEYYFFGHSMGARVAYELACALDKRGVHLPIELFVSGARGPQVVGHTQTLYNLPDCEFLQEIGHLNGTPREILENKALMDLVMPMLRADFKLCETWKAGGEYKLPIPLRIFGGLNDRDVSVEEMGRWAECTEEGVTRYLLPGGHFFLNSHCDDLLKIIRQRIALSQQKTFEPSELVS